ncbi:unnamed protein product [Haemonchus placei]|uniref:Uncharacterized protein n=1 Tax=Haemonchus placei TaxID=6290 RepID=A0A3P7YDN6_HAEPC|nr:unnamed protein product [Haemonchus placei]
MNVGSLPNIRKNGVFWILLRVDVLYMNVQAEMNWSQSH